MGTVLNNLEHQGVLEILVLETYNHDLLRVKYKKLPECLWNCVWCFEEENHNGAWIAGLSDDGCLNSVALHLIGNVWRWFWRFNYVWHDFKDLIVFDNDFKDSIVRDNDFQD